MIAAASAALKKVLILSSNNKNKLLLTWQRHLKEISFDEIEQSLYTFNEMVILLKSLIIIIKLYYAFDGIKAFTN